VTPVLAIDPGLKPGCVALDENGIVWRASHKLFTDAFTGGAFPLVATEGQWLHGRDVDANSIITLAFRAGFTLASIPALRRMRIPPKVWRGTNASKQVVQNRILRTLAPSERALFSAIPKSRHGDVLDAIGIGRAAQRLASEGNTDHDYTL
jgi:hypothetical protein